MKGITEKEDIFWQQFVLLRKHLNFYIFTLTNEGWFKVNNFIWEMGDMYIKVLLFIYNNML